MRSWCISLSLALLLAGCSTSVTNRPNFGSPDLAMLESNLAADEGARLEQLPLPALLQQGSDYLAQGNLALARLHFLMAIKKDSASAAAFTGFGNVEAKAGDLQKAEIAYRLALRTDPDYVPALLPLARLQRSAGNLEGALELLQQATTLQPGNPEILSELGIALDQLERFAEAEQLHLKATAHRPEIASTFNNLGFHYLQRERYEQAIPPLQKALRLDPRNEMTRNNLAVGYLLMGEAERALQLFKESVGEAAAWNNIGYLYMTQGNRKLAEKAFREALALNPQFYVQAKNNLDDLQRRMAQTDEPFVPGREK
ncbi:MAG: tetratricopeptide repeat protein [Desulfuromonadales bacterium]|nr:tetratricopeptide repeat protein [Desulfuromonadales bacterium]